MPVDFHRAHVPCAVESIRLLLVVHTHAAAAAYVWQIRVSCVPEPTTKHNQRKEMKRKRKEKKNKKSKRRKTSCGACQSKSLEAASTTNNVKSELMNVCSSSWTVGRIDQLNGFLRFEEFVVKEEDLRIQTGLQVWIPQKVRRRRRRCCCCWWWIGGGACACAFHTWDNLGVVEGRERYTTTGCLVRQILRVSACHIPCHCSSQTRRNTTDGFAISDFLAKKKRKTHRSKTPSPKERRRNWVDKERERGRRNLVVKEGEEEEATHWKLECGDVRLCSRTNWARLWQRVRKCTRVQEFWERSSWAVWQWYWCCRICRRWSGKRRRRWRDPVQKRRELRRDSSWGLVGCKGLPVRDPQCSDCERSCVVYRCGTANNLLASSLLLPALSRSLPWMPMSSLESTQEVRCAYIVASWTTSRLPAHTRTQIHLQTRKMHACRWWSSS